MSLRHLGFLFVIVAFITMIVLTGIREVKFNNEMEECLTTVDRCLANNESLIKQVAELKLLVEKRTKERDMTIEVLQGVFEDDAIANILRRSNNEELQEDSAKD